MSFQKMMTPSQDFWSISSVTRLEMVEKTSVTKVQSFTAKADNNEDHGRSSSSLNEEVISKERKFVVIFSDPKWQACESGEHVILSHCL